MKTFERGNITELEVQLQLVKRGYLVFTPVNDASFVDLIVKFDDGYKSVQVKTATKTGTGFMIYLYSTCGGKGKKYYDPATLDYFATQFDGKIYFIPVKDVCGIGRIVLRLNTTYKNQNKAFYASTYELP